MSKLSTPADRWMLEGIKEHEEFNLAFLSAKEHGLNAGFFFLRARETVGHGNWGQFILGYAHVLSPRTIERYVALATDALEWVKENQPRLTGLDKLQDAARAMVIQSPRGLVALCRELRIMRQFGEYDAVRYAAQKRLGNAPRQVEFDFLKVTHSIEALTHLDEPNYTWQLPDGKTERDALGELRGQLQTVLAKIDAKLTETIET